MVQEIRALVVGAQNGDRNAYDILVRRFQDMAVGYAYSLLGDFHWAEDAAQEAFIEAACSLSALREPTAFAGWLRTILFKHCDRIKRKKRVPTVSIEAALEVPSSITEPARSVEVEAMRTEVQRAIQELPEHQRVVVLLFYMAEYSQAEVADFLELPLTTVKKRLHDARQNLKQRMIDMMKEELQEQRPSKDDEFMKRLHEMMKAVDKGDLDTTRTLLKAEPALINAKGYYHPASDVETTPLLVAAGIDETELALFLLEQGANPHVVLDDGETALQSAAFHQNQVLADALAARGVQIDIFAASGLGDVERVQAFINENPEIVHATDNSGATPLHWSGNVEVARVLLQAGADIEATDDRYHNTPVEYSWHPPVQHFLISQGAIVRFHLACSLGCVAAARQLLQDNPDLAMTPNGDCRPHANALPITIAALSGEVEMVKLLLEHGVDINTPDPADRGATALHTAALVGHLEIVVFLLQHGADIMAKTDKGVTPLASALKGLREKWWETCIENPHPPHHQEVVDLLRQHGARE